MSNQAEHEHEPSQTLTPEEQRQSLLSQIDAAKEVVYELSDEEVEQVAGGGKTIFDLLKEKSTFQGDGHTTIYMPIREKKPGLPDLFEQQHPQPISPHFPH